MLERTTELERTTLEKRALALRDRLRSKHADMRLVRIYFSSPVWRRETHYLELYCYSSGKSIGTTCNITGSAEDFQRAEERFDKLITFAKENGLL